jgi:NAD(P)-dependent dehydrogenase (short-subunit alcohol dehydrogenase family)
MSDKYETEILARKPANLFDMTGKVVVITGGSRGLGRAMAHGFARARAQIVVAPERARWGLVVRTPSIGGAENAACFSYSRRVRSVETSSLCFE